MSKKAFKSQASSSRAVNGALGALTDGTTFGSGLGASSFGAVASSSLSYVYEPPDLSRLSEPNVGVAFKNIQKKDGTTKAKALDDLQTFVLSLAAEKRELEDAMLEAWVGLLEQLATWSSDLEVSTRSRSTPALPSIPLAASVSSLILSKGISRSHAVNGWQSTCLRSCLPGLQVCTIMTNL